PALYARWMQLGAFSPFFRAHSMINSRDAEPWSFGEEVEDIARNFIRLRYRLLPYLYSAFEEARFGMPIARSLALEWPQDPKIYQQPYDAAYLFGPEILVIPVESHRQLAKIYLPAGQWYDFYDDSLLEGGKEHLIELNIEKLPLYVRAGAVVAMQSPVMHTEAAHAGVLHLHVYSGEASRKVHVFEDDGLANTETHISDFASRMGIHHGHERRLSLEPQLGNYPSEFRKVKLYLHGVDADVDIFLNGIKPKVSHEDFKLVEPVSRFDPFMPAVGTAPKVENLPVIEFDWDARTAYELLY
ncbi:MAG TPA: TIM-barrel domain-containing protein, partial [Bacteroidia bacterium]|nr:TIM-barrel domain-containing protein [Bacteroidia bacterium]